MSEFSQYLESFKTAYWSDENPNNCRCRGSGWVLSELDTWHKCPVHFKNQIHPEDYYPDVCPECGDGENFSPYDCPNCGDKLKAEIAKVYDEQMALPLEESLPTYDENGEIPF